MVSGGGGTARGPRRAPRWPPPPQKVPGTPSYRPFSEDPHSIWHFLLAVPLPEGELIPGARRRQGLEAEAGKKPRGTDIEPSSTSDLRLAFWGEVSREVSSTFSPSTLLPTTYSVPEDRLPSRLAESPAMAVVGTRDCVAPRESDLALRTDVLAAVRVAEALIYGARSL